MTFVPASRRTVFAGGLLLVALATAAPVLASTIAVSIVDKTFDPAGIVVAQGDTVTWTVKKSINEPHSVTSGAPGGPDVGKAFDSGTDKLTDVGGTYSHTFAAAGEYAYFCQVHPTEMKGTVTVLAEGGHPGEAGEGIPIERRLIGAGTLAATLIVLFGAALVWRRMNRA